MIAGWVRDRLGGINAPSPTDWTQNRLGAFLLKLEMDDLDDATYLQICRDTGQWQLLTKKLLALDRTDEAVEVIRQHLDRNVLVVADAFVEHGKADHLAQVLRGRLNERHAVNYRDWLIRHAESRGEWDDALQVATLQFSYLPSVEHFNGLKRVATSMGNWPERRKALMDELETQKEHAVLTLLHLAEGDAGAALHWLKARLRAGISSGHLPESLALQVAEAAAREHPAESARLYRMVAHAEIGRRDRRNYAEAARLLAKARDLYRQAGEDVEWDRVIADVRASNGRLRALQEKLMLMGL
jgi:uncharacterized Zn finger protein